MLTEGKQRLLDHLNESTNFCEKDIQTMTPTLDKFAELIERDLTEDNEVHTRRLKAALDSCYAALNPLSEHLGQISPQLLGVQAKLVSLRRCIKASEAKRKVIHGNFNSDLAQTYRSR